MLHNLCIFQSYEKVKIVELATGNENPQEWTFLPGNWTMMLFHARFEQFAIFKFFPDQGSTADDILILNLASRKQFWMREETLVDQILQKFNRNFDGRFDGHDFNDDINQFHWYFDIDSIHTRANAIDIRCRYGQYRDIKWLG